MPQTLDPFLEFAQEQMRLGKSQLPPWMTQDSELLRIAREYFPEIPLIPPHQLEKPNTQAVAILARQECPLPSSDLEAFDMIAVGGPPAATVALQATLQGKTLLYVSDQNLAPIGKQIRPIWAGAGNHGEPDVITEGPAYLSGYFPLSFIFKEILRLILPKRFQKSTSDPDYPWLCLNFSEWLKNPRQWLAGLRVFWGNILLAQQYVRALKRGQEPEIIKSMAQRVLDSGNYLENINQSTASILRKPRGSLILAYSQAQLKSLLQMQAALKKLGQDLRPISAVQAEERYGLYPRQALGMMEKIHDFIFEADFLEKMTAQIQKNRGQVIRNWRLSRVFVDTETQNGGVLEFYEVNTAQEKIFHYKKFSRAHLSLGATLFTPSVYDLVSVTGVSINALIIGANIKGGPIVCGGTNHLVPLLEPRLISLRDPLDSKAQETAVSFVRLSTGACVSPLDRGENWYHYHAGHALHLLHQVCQTLPENCSLKILSVSGCNRVIGKDGRQIEMHPCIRVNHQNFICESLCLQLGAGGGGLTQMGAIPQQMLKGN